MRELVRQNRWFFAVFALLGVALRLLFVYWFPHNAGDSLLYTDIAQNWLHHGSYALTENSAVVATLIRLPGYPAFLAALFEILGATPEKMLPVLLVQTFVDLAGCFIVGALALELFNSQTAKWSFALAALCPFTANYVALPLTETLAIFFTAWVLFFSAKALRCMDADQPALLLWSGCGLALAAGIVLRPDGGILLGAVLLFLFSRLFYFRDRRPVLAAGLIVTVLALAPLTPWTIRNWQVFQVFQPLAPRYANAPGEYAPMGFNRWIKTWLVEYVSVEDIFWNVSTETPGEAIRLESLPQRAFSSEEERERVSALFAEFNQTFMMTQQTDAKFAALADERIARSPLRYYVALPALRIADMWLRPRTEMLPVDQHWWTFDDPPESWFAIGYGLLNLLLVGAGSIGLWKFRAVRIYGLLLGFVLFRSLFLSTMENPEPRYTLECFPVVLVMAANLFARTKQRVSDKSV